MAVNRPQPLPARLWDREWIPWLSALAIVLLAFGARIYRIFDLPPGLSGDEAANLTDIMRVLEGGYLPLYFEANNGREPLFIYLQTPLVALLGPTPYALRLTSALLGVLTVVLAYRWTKDLLGSGDHPAGRWAPAVAAFLLATSLWHVNLSRIGLRAIALPLLALAALILFWRGYSRGSKGYLLASGAFLGLSLYTYIASRLLPLAPLLFILGRRAWARAIPHATQRGLALMAAGLALVASPLAYFAWTNPLLFWGRAATVSTLDPSAPPTWEAVARTLGMLVWKGSTDNIFDLDARPAFEGPLAFFFLLGLGLALTVLWVRRGGRAGPAWLPSWRTEACLLALVWLLVMISPSFFSYPAPHFLRALGAIPAVYLFPALGITWLAGRFSALSSPGWRSPALLALAVLTLGSGFNSLGDYFRLASSNQSYYDFDGDKLDLGIYIRERSREIPIYGDQQLMADGTIRALARGASAVTFDSRWAVVFPPYPVEYLFPASGLLQRDFGRYLPADSERFVLTDRLGKEMAVGYRVNGREALAYSRTMPSAPLWGAKQPPREPAGATSIAGEIALRGYGLLDEGPGRPFRVALAWEALRQPSLSYHISVKAFDMAGKAWAQSDSPPGRGGYPTSKWHAGEWVYDIHELTLEPGATPGPYYLEVTVYDFQTLHIFPVLSADGQPLAQHYLLGNIQVDTQAR